MRQTQVFDVAESKSDKPPFVMDIQQAVEQGAHYLAVLPVEGGWIYAVNTSREGAQQALAAIKAERDA